MPGYSDDWIAIVQSGHADTAYERYRYTSGATGGSISFGTLPPGTYVARGFQHGTYTTVVSSSTFTVTAPAPTTTIDAVVTGAGSVSVTYAGLAGYNHDWIGIAPAGGAPTSDIAWVYSFGAASGTASFAGIAPGTYVARAFFDDSFTIAAESASFVVP
jgi:hypothetical protein